jgi:hypothetical protein
MGPRQIFFGFQATDDLSGVSDFNFFDKFSVQLTGPSKQTTFLVVSCTQTQGATPVSGSCECSVTFPTQAETGVWNITFLRVPDRAGNGGFAGRSDFLPNGMGQLCYPTANCVAVPTVLVISAGDGAPPDLQTVSIVSPGPSDVITTLGITDNLSGVSFVRVRYTSTLTTQFQECFPPLTSGSTTNGIWECTITFSQFAARGQWVLSVQLFDIAGNTRFYSRRASDGFLCYADPGQPLVCQDFGTTDIVLQ